MASFQLHVNSAAVWLTNDGRTADQKQKRFTSFGRTLNKHAPPRSQNIITILCKIITRMKLLFSKYLGGYSYSFQRSSELGKNSPQEFSRVFLAITVTWFMVFELKM